MYQRILEHLMLNKTITTWQAIMDYNCTRLSEYIRQIRKNYIIEDEWVDFINTYGEKSQYKKYIFKGAK